MAFKQFDINSREVRQRIQDYLDKNDLTWKTLAERTGIDATILSKYNTGKLQTLATENYFAIAKTMMISAERLVYGENGPAYRGLNSEERYFLRDFRMLDEGDKHIIQALVQRLKEANAFAREI